MCTLPLTAALSHVSPRYCRAHYCRAAAHNAIHYQAHRHTLLRALRANYCAHCRAHCHTLPHTATHCHTLPHTATLIHLYESCLNKHTVTPCNKLQHTASHCSTLQHIRMAPAYCNTLQHTATHCNTSLQRTVITAKYCNHFHILQQTAIHCATHCRTLRHT